MIFAHAADLHLDSPFVGLSRYEGAPLETFRAATRRALEQLIDECVESDVAFLLLAGDVFDDDWKDYATGLWFVDALQRLGDAGIHVYLIRGNHDAASRVTKELKLPDHVTEFATRKPQTVIDEERGVAIHGQGFASRAVTSDLAKSFPDAIPGLLNIGLLHTSLDGRPGHAPYAPTTVETLRSKGYDYWALGHIHAREVLSEDPWIVFPGNLQGRHARETGPKGATFVHADESGRIERVEHRDCDVVRWCQIALEAPHDATADGLLGIVGDELEAVRESADGRSIAVRLTVSGSTAAHEELMADGDRWTAECRARANELDDVWIERIKLRTAAPLELAALESRDDPIGLVVRELRSLSRDGESLELLNAELESVRQRLPREIRDEIDVAELANDAERLLVHRLLGGGAST